MAVSPVFRQQQCAAVQIASVSREVPTSARGITWLNDRCGGVSGSGLPIGTHKRVAYSDAWRTICGMTVSWTCPNKLYHEAPKNPVVLARACSQRAPSRKRGTPGEWYDLGRCIEAGGAFANRQIYSRSRSASSGFQLSRNTCTSHDALGGAAEAARFPLYNPAIGHL